MVQVQSARKSNCTGCLELPETDWKLRGKAVRGFPKDSAHCGENNIMSSRSAYTSEVANHVRLFTDWRFIALARWDPSVPSAWNLLDAGAITLQ